MIKTNETKFLKRNDRGNNGEIKSMEYWFTANETEYVVGKNDKEIAHFPFDGLISRDEAQNMAHDVCAYLNAYYRPYAQKVEEARLTKE